jgi:hypothetical protein
MSNQDDLASSFLKRFQIFLVLRERVCPALVAFPIIACSMVHG